MHPNIRSILEDKFQYPLTDRGGCNKIYKKPKIRPREISVSTNGSRGVQHAKDFYFVLDQIYFSIH